MSEEPIYPTDNPQNLQTSIENRKNRYTCHTRKAWRDTVAKFSTTDEGEAILNIENFEVMSGFEAPYMHALAQSLRPHNAIILNVGFGLGIADQAIQDAKPLQHHIIELNRDVYQQALQWKMTQRHQDKIFIYHADWREMLPQFAAEGLTFDGVLYDAYPLDVSELCRDSVGFLGDLLDLRLVKETSGRIAFYLDSVDGIGEKFQAYLRELGVGKISVSKVPVVLPEREVEYWSTPYFLAPLLENISYATRH